MIDMIDMIERIKKKIIIRRRTSLLFAPQRNLHLHQIILRSLIIGTQQSRSTEAPCDHCED